MASTALTLQGRHAVVTGAARASAPPSSANWQTKARA